MNAGAVVGCWSGRRCVRRHCREPYRALQRRAGKARGRCPPCTARRRQAADRRLRRPSGRRRDSPRRDAAPLGRRRPPRQVVSVTNGDIGHWRDGRRTAGPAAARPRSRRPPESSAPPPQVLDIHDGELEPTLENRRTITRLIREWKADIVIAHRPNDYHPDHRYVGVLVQDSAYMVTVPFFCPDTPTSRRTRCSSTRDDGFQRPNPFRPDVVVAIDAVIDKKVDALVEHGVAVRRRGRERHRPMPKDAADLKARQANGRPRQLRQPRRPYGRPLPRQAHRALRRRGGQEGPLRRGLRDLRIRPPPHAARSCGSCSPSCRRGSSWTRDVGQAERLR